MMDRIAIEVRERPELRRHRARDAHAAAGDRRRRHRRGRPRHRRHAQARVPSSATRRPARRRCASRASVRACPSSACRRLWRPARKLAMVWGMHCVLTERSREPGGHGAQGLPHRLRRGLRQGRRGRDHRRRRAAGLARHHQHGAHRLPRRRRAIRWPKGREAPCKSARRMPAFIRDFDARPVAF